MKVLKEYEISDKDGRKLVRELSNGLTTETLLEPSAVWLLAQKPDDEPDPAIVDLAEVAQKLSEVEDLKARVTALESQLAK